MAVRRALPCLRDARAKRHSRFHALPALTFARRGPNPRGRAEFSPGYYDSDEHSVRVTIGDGHDALAHELAHAALGKIPGEGWHGRRFWNLVRAVAAEGWPEIGWRFVDAPERGHLLDRWIGDRLRDHYSPTAG